MGIIGDHRGFPGGASAGDTRDTGSTPGMSVNPLQCSCLENPMDSGAWQAIVHRVTQLDTSKAT